jgi:DNA-binding CsgD family transcriptional regulator
MKSLKKLQQTAVDAVQDESPLEVETTSPIRLGPRLHLSVEHAAIAQELTEREMHFVLCLGRGMEVKEIAKKLGITEGGVFYHLNGLRRKTRMSRHSLGIMGYALLGQPDSTQVAA